ncbi:hypothetical protein KP509_1Z305600 [Ceratopteris richardii]|nr:hypothetical protein KP509_1Z305600 [Ceratopteris richardii]KAH6554804.1 hypothetical protein KP509_1Z305600 [Ceratopteris richardii]
MDVRILALWQEQNAAFERATAAGFHADNMADLIAFSDHFGAQRFRTACSNFLAVLKNRHERSIRYESLEALRCSKIQQGSVPYVTEKVCQNLDGSKPEGSHLCQGDRTDKSDTIMFENVGGRSREAKGTEMRKRWGPPENIRTELFLSQNETDSASCESSNGGSVECSPEVQRCMKVCIEQESCPSVQRESMTNTTAEADVVLAGYISSLKQSSYMEANEADSLSSQDKVSSSVQSVSVPGNSALEKSSLEKSRAEILNSSSNCVSKCDGRGFDCSDTAVAPGRRLSVQDAISLFENKQRRHSVDSVAKRRIIKQEPDRRTSLEVEGTSPKCWDSRKDPETIGLQLCGLSCKSGIAIMGMECSLDAPVNSIEVSHESIQGRYIGSKVHSISGAFDKASSCVQLQPSASSLIPNSVEATTKKHSEGNHPSERQLKGQLKGAVLETAPSVKDVESNQLCVGEPIVYSKTDCLDRTGPANAIYFVEHKRKESAGCVLDDSREVLSPLGIEDLSTGLQKSLGEGSSYSLNTDAVKFVESRSIEPEISELVARAHKSDYLGPKLEMESATELERQEINQIENIIVSSDLPLEHSHNTDSLERSSGSSLDQDMQSLCVMAEDERCMNGKDADGPKGRLYEQYRKLRDAKLKDQDSMRAEREAKLKMMEETLRRRKAEMDIQTTRLSRNICSQSFTMKLDDTAADTEAKKLAGKDQVKPMMVSSSSPLPSRKETVSTLKPQSARKPGPVSQKGATPPRNSNKLIPSVSPRMSSRSSAMGVNIHKTTAASKGDNPLTKSVPCFANMRKENTKPSSGGSLRSSRVHPKKADPGGAPGVFGTPPLESNGNGNVPACSNFSRSVTSKEEPRNRSTLLRKSCANMNDLKALSTSIDDGNCKSKRDKIVDSVTNNKLRQSTVGSFQEGKPFLRKGCGSGPGSLTHTLRSKGISSVNVAKISNGEADAEALQNKICSENETAQEIHDKSIAGNLLKAEKMDVKDDDDLIPVNQIDVQQSETSILCEDNSEMRLDESIKVDTSAHSDALPCCVTDIQEIHDSVSSLIDNEMLNDSPVLPKSILNSNFISETAGLNSEENAKSLSHSDEDVVESIQIEHVETAPSLMSTSSPLHKTPFASFYHPPLSSLLYSENSSPTTDVKGESTTWNFPRPQPDIRWEALEKATTASQPKEQVRGFKRLLKFGRKNRMSEVAATDCISASTTSGDDEPEVQSHFTDEITSRRRLPERRYNDDEFGSTSQAEEEKSAYCLRSSIPNPPANFRLRDDHISTSTMLRAPRSFFSLSSFRSKGGECKLRSRDPAHA